MILPDELALFIATHYFKIEFVVQNERYRNKCFIIQHVDVDDGLD